MIRALVFSVCFTTLCAFVAYLSANANGQRKGIESLPIPISCSELLAAAPTERMHILLKDFKPGKFFASRDVDQNKEWEFLFVPFYPQSWDSLKSNYSATIVRFDQISDLDELNELVDCGEIEVQFWPERQKIDDDVHSRLA